MLNKKLVATLLIGCFGFATAQAGDQVEVNFTASVVSSACTLKVENAKSHTINFGNFRDIDQKSTFESFTLKLTDCGAGAKYAVISATPTGNKEGNLIKSRGAGKVNIAFYNNDNEEGTDKYNLDNFNLPNSENSPEGAERTFYVRLENAGETNPVGAVNETVTFTAEYK